MRIVELWNTDLKQSYALFNTFPKEENGFVNNAYGYTFEKFIDYVCAKAENSKSRNLQKGFVPDTVYILINDDEKYVGIGNCILGYGKEPKPEAKPRKDNYIYRV